MGIEETDDGKAAIKGIEHIKELMREIGLPGIGSLGVNPEDFELLAEMSVKNGSNVSNPREMKRKTIWCSSISI
jgi:alcohol dehydrogenase class IV